MEDVKQCLRLSVLDGRHYGGLAVENVADAAILDGDDDATSEMRRVGRLQNIALMPIRCTRSEVENRGMQTTGVMIRAVKECLPVYPWGC